MQVAKNSIRLTSFECLLFNNTEKGGALLSSIALMPLDLYLETITCKDAPGNLNIPCNDFNYLGQPSHPDPFFAKFVDIDPFISKILREPVPSSY